MEFFDLAAFLIVLTALFSYVNHRWLKLPTTIGLMLLGLAFALASAVMGYFVPEVIQPIRAAVEHIDLNKALLDGMLGFLLFAGALHVKLSDLVREKWVVGTLATIGVVISTALVGLLTWAALWAVGLEVSLYACMLFGALISPTDPIAVLAIMRKIGAPKELETQIVGESLFNDGVGVVVFIALLSLGGMPAAFDLGQVALLLARQAGGGLVFGLAVGFLACWMLRSVDDYKIEILISLAAVAGGYALASAWRLSGPIAMVGAGLVFGNLGRNLAMSELTRERLDLFWDLIDEFLNAVLFVLIGLKVLVLTVTARAMAAGLLLIPAILAARLASVAVPALLLRPWRRLPPSSLAFTITYDGQATTALPWRRLPASSLVFLTWGGLRGGLSLAMALSLPSAPAGPTAAEREIVLTITYIVVLFSIVVQGLTIGPLMRRLMRSKSEVSLSKGH